MKWPYKHFRLLVLPIYGGLPVKFRTYIGEPIPYDPNITAKELAEKVRALTFTQNNLLNTSAFDTKHALVSRHTKR